MRAVITVVGKDTVGIVAKIAALCTEYNLNIVELTQSVLQEFFVMIMLAEISAANAPFPVVADAFAALGEKTGLSVRIMHEDIFNSMHTV